MNLFVDPPEEIKANPEYQDLVKFAKYALTPTSEIFILFLKKHPQVVNDMQKFDNLFISDEDTFENRIKYLNKHEDHGEFASNVYAVLPVLQPLIYHLKRFGLIMYITPFPSNDIDKGRMNPSLLKIITDYMRYKAENQDYLQRLEDEKEEKTRKPSKSKVAKPKQQPQQPRSALGEINDSIIYGEGTWKRPREVFEITSSPELNEEDWEKDLLGWGANPKDIENVKKSMVGLPEKTQVQIVPSRRVDKLIIVDSFDEKPRTKAISSMYDPIVLSDED